MSWKVIWRICIVQASCDVVICKNQPNIPLCQEVNSVTELIMYFTRFSEGWQTRTGRTG